MAAPWSKKTDPPAPLKLEDDGPEFPVQGHAGSDVTAAAIDADSAVKAPGLHSEPVSADSDTDGSAKGAQREKNRGLEYLVIAGCIAYIITFVVGQRQNTRIAKEWAASYHELFLDHFAQAGQGCESPDLTPTAFPLYAETANEYMYYATGRRGCESLTLTLKLRARHSLVTQILDLTRPQEPDRIIMEVALNDEEVERIVLAVFPRSDLLSKTAELQLSDLTAVQQVKQLARELVCMTEATEIVTALLTPNIVELLNDHKDLIELIHLTDQNEAAVPGRLHHPKKVLRCVYRLPQKPIDNMHRLLALMELPLHLVDVLHKFKLPPPLRAKAESRRNSSEQVQLVSRKREEHDAMLRRAQELKQQKRQQEREEYDKLTPAQKAKRDAKAVKDQQKQMRKAKPAMRVKKL